MLTAQQIAQKWQRNAAAAGPAIQAAVQAMTINPMELAAGSEEAWFRGVQKAHQTSKYSDRCSRVTMQEWKQAMLQKGVPNYANGIAGGQRKFETFMRDFIPHLQAGVNQLQPRGTLQQNISRAVQMMNHNATFRLRGGGGGGVMPPAQ